MTRTSLSRACLLAISLALAAPLAQAAEPADSAALPAPDAALQASIDGGWRAPANTARDRYRHPGQTLAFFGIGPGQTVVEITPGGGWYAEILAPYLQAKGRYVAAVVDPAAVAEGGGRDYQQRSRDGLEKKFADAPAQFGKAAVVGYDPAAPVLGPAGSADLVLTFRNVHNWRGAGQAEGMFEGFYRVLKPGGVLGVVEHRARADVPADDKSGYVGQAQVIALAQAAGFELAGSSEVNANPRDTKDHPNGVWTLPPSNNHPESERAKYQAIGESDRMTLRFVKPAGK
ncbi:methyltransferase [Pseudoxanthomonas broegbernensis]|uniref:Methyltransferase n=1 Tax=Pseudoxanthomonas broegbernensis TaxID=83619 RepID=A0A7V8GN20_9GAMM|nr:class I SAM-dependent methyltransferase [Pseudoxanthomonas broegbernensis]KAF1686859.1 methyltransferase [Pseudoxanthomonas broegbernensis]MBB6065551.1 putative methyltransferase [Pseudoxanthomonas broegbernensis]